MAKPEKWKRLFSVIWLRLRENRTTKPVTVMSTPFAQVDDNFAKFKGYKIVVRCSSNAYAPHPVNYFATVFKGKKEIVSIHHIDGIQLGSERTVSKLLSEFGDTDFVPFKEWAK